MMWNKGTAPKVTSRLIAAWLGTSGVVKSAADGKVQKPEVYRVIAHDEGYTPHASKNPGEGHPTVGFGTYLDGSNREYLDSLGYNYRKLLAGEVELPEKVAYNLVNRKLVGLSRQLQSDYSGLHQKPGYAHLLSAAYRNPALFGPRSQEFYRRGDMNAFAANIAADWKLPDSAKQYNGVYRRALRNAYDFAAANKLPIANAINKYRSDPWYPRSDAELQSVYRNLLKSIKR